MKGSARIGKERLSEGLAVASCATPSKTTTRTLYEPAGGFVCVAAALLQHEVDVLLAGASGLSHRSDDRPRHDAVWTSRNVEAESLLAGTSPAENHVEQSRRYRVRACLACARSLRGKKRVLAGAAKWRESGVGDGGWVKAVICPSRSICSPEMGMRYQCVTRATAKWHLVRGIR